MKQTNIKNIPANNKFAFQHAIINYFNKNGIMPTIKIKKSKHIK